MYTICKSCKSYEKICGVKIHPVTSCKAYQPKEENKNMSNDDVYNDYDNVNKPEHYCSGAHECIDVMEAMFGTCAVMDFCRCNIFKYRFRADKKNGDEDIKKAEWYESKLMELENKVSEKRIYR